MFLLSVVLFSFHSVHFFIVKLMRYVIILIQLLCMYVCMPLLLMQLPVQLDAKPVIRTVYVTRLAARKDISTLQGINALVSFYSISYYFLFLAV